MDNPAPAPHVWRMSYDSDILIAGGGLNGTTLALALTAGGFNVTLVDPRATETRAARDFDGRSYAMSVASCRVLKALDIWPALSDDAQPILDIKVSDGRVGQGPSPLFLAFDHAEIEEGPMGHMVEDRHLRPTLLDAVAARKITHHAGVAICDHTTDAGGVTATFDTGDSHRTRLLIGCDGKNSAIGARVGIKRTGWGYDQTSLVCAVTHEKPHNGTAHQLFLEAGPLAILPLSQNRASIVWTERTARAEAIAHLDDEGYLDILRPRFGDFLGAISLVGQRGTFPLALSIANDFIADRVALVGDAAHAVHPIAGQGLNAGLKDVAALAEVLTDAARRGEDIGRHEVLQRYQTWRRFDVMSLAVATDSFNRLFSNDNTLLRAARDIGLGTVNALPGLRRRFIREAAGLTGDLPRLAQGKPL